MASHAGVDEKSIMLRTRLAELFIDSVRLHSGPEVEFRNSLSRAYYALFHAGMALLLSTGRAEKDIRKFSHGEFLRQMRRQLGRSVGALITESYEFRRMADYDPQANFPEHVVVAKMKAIRTHVLWMCRESQKALH